MISHARLSEFLAALETKSPTDRIDTIANAVIETGGTFAPDVSDGEWNDPGDTVAEISLHGILAWGTDTADATTQWIKSARRRLAEMEVV